MLIKYLFLGCCIFYESGKQREPEKLSCAIFRAPGNKESNDDPVTSTQY